MRIVRTLIGILLLTSLAAPLSAAPGDHDAPPGGGPMVVGDGIIVPGHRIGPLQVGMSVAQILQVMPPGGHRETFTAERIILYEWRTQGIWVSLDAGTQAVRVISAFGMGPYRTDSGVGLLASDAKMRAVYGQESRRYNYPDERVTLVRYVSLGLQFGLVNQPGNALVHGRIFTIGIFPPGREPPLARPAAP